MTEPEERRPDRVELNPEFVRNPPRVERAFIQQLDERVPEGNTRLVVEFERDERLEAQGRRVAIQFGGDILMLRDDGEGADERAGDGLYSAFIDVDVAALEEANRRIEAARQETVPVYRQRERVAERRSQLFDVAGFQEGELIDAVPPLALDVVFPDRSLVITDVDVVQDPQRTYDPCAEYHGATAGNPDGVWTFGHLMREMANEAETGIEPSTFVLEWLESWEEDQVVGEWTVSARPEIRQRIIDRWIEASGGIGEPLDLSQAPFRLQAIVNRVDLRENLLFGPGSGGEARFVFRALNIQRDEHGEVLSCADAPMTVIFEYGVPKNTCEAARTWGQQWYDLGQSVPGTASYNAALAEITEQYAVAGADPDKPHASALNQIRTNDAFVYEHPWEPNRWEMREFRLLDDPGFLVHDTLKQSVQSPGPIGTLERVADFIAEHAEEIVDDDYEVPLEYQGEPFRAGSTNYHYTGFWNPPFDDPPLVPNPRFGQPGEPEQLDARHSFSLNTCQACHAAETATGFTHVKGREYGEESDLSGFMTGIQVTDPALGEDESVGSPRYFNELERRSNDLDLLVNSSCTLELPPFELFFDPLRMVH